MKNYRYSNSPRDSKARESSQKEYLGNYLGIVVQNNDPDKRGRIKIYVPHLSATVYDNWLGGSSGFTDKKFSFIGKNIDSDLNVIIDKLKEILPWATCAAPLMGASGSGRYNAYEETGSVSDSSKLNTTTKSTKTQFSKYGLNDDGIGEKPARVYEVKELEVHDSFSTAIDGISGAGAPNIINKYSYQYKPSSYSNQPKGSFSIPNVGSHVWVFFQNGDPSNPVYFAAAHGEKDWNQIYDSMDGQHGPDYPGAYENKNKDEGTYNHNTETYRNKYVLNQKGGTLEIVNTDNREILKLTHYSGSFKEYNNEAAIELVTGQDQKLVQGHQFTTVKGHRNDSTELNYDQIIRGDYYRKVGTFNHGKFEEWQSELKTLTEIKQLFEIRRVEYIQGDSQNIYLPKVSSFSKKEPPGKTGHAACPVCSHADRPAIYKDKSTPLTARLPLVTTIANQYLDAGSGFVFPLSLGLPIIPEKEQPPANPTNFLKSGKCPCCGGDGKSPSTAGSFDFVKEDKDTLFSNEIEGSIEKLTEIEKELGLGGSEIVNITKHKIENIGLVMNDFPSIRIDPVGKISYNEIIPLKGGVIRNQKAHPLIELVHTDEMPGGSYTLNCANKFNVQAGSNGISFKTFGPVDIGGTIVSVGAEQVNIGSQNEINISAKNEDKTGRINIIADILSMRQSEYKQVLIEGSLGISNNLIVRGGAHVEGELYCQHVTAPVEMKTTDANTAYGQINPVQIGYAQIGYGSSGGFHPVYGFGASPMACNTYTHAHTYESIPTTFMRSEGDVRAEATMLVGKGEVPHKGVENGGFLTKLTDKLGGMVDGVVDDFMI